MLTFKFTSNLTLFHQNLGVACMTNAVDVAFYEFRYAGSWLHEKQGANKHGQEARRLGVKG